MGESETIIMTDGNWWSYVHASYQSAGVRDSCGQPVDFPGCTVRYISTDAGRQFALTDYSCLFDCVSCPCETERDQTDQQQYPDVYFDGATLWMTYEYRGRVMLRQSTDGITFTEWERVHQTGPFYRWLRECGAGEAIGEHPFVPYDYECLAGAPPGIFLQDGVIHIFLGLGSGPGSMGCYKGTVGTDPAFFTPCEHNPLFTGAASYGGLETAGVDAHPYWDFKTISSAEIQQVGDRFYMLYEGIRGPGPGDGGDTQFGLGLARSVTAALDGPWETFDGNPILVDLPANVGVGHADLVVHEGVTYLYTSLDGNVRSRLKLVWHE